MITTGTTTTLGVIADEQAERNPLTTSKRGRKAGGGKPTSKPLVSNGRPLRRYELSDPSHATDEVRAMHKPFSVITLGSIRGMTIDIDGSDIDERMLARDIDPSCLTQEGDVVLSLSAPFASACIDKAAEGLFIPNTCAVIRMDDETRKVLDPWFLTGYLNRSVVRRDVLESKATDGNWKTLRIEDLRTLEVYLPPIDVQRALGDAMKADVKTMRSHFAAQKTHDALVDDAYATARAMCKEANEE